MTLREELYRNAVKADKEKKIKEEEHFKCVEVYLKDVCRNAALKGKFEIVVNYAKLTDNTTLTDKDIEKFASLHELDFIPTDGIHLPLLSFKTAKKDNV